MFFYYHGEIEFVMIISKTKKKVKNKKSQNLKGPNVVNFFFNFC